MWRKVSHESAATICSQDEVEENGCCVKQPPFRGSSLSYEANMKNTDWWDEAPSSLIDRCVSNRLDHNLGNNRQFPCDVLKLHTSIENCQTHELNGTEPFYKINIHSVIQWIPRLVWSLNVPYLVHHNPTLDLIFYLCMHFFNSENVLNWMNETILNMFSEMWPTACSHVSDCEWGKVDVMGRGIVAFP
jgi:hypothetical protein